MMIGLEKLFMVIQHVHTLNSSSKKKKKLINFLSDYEIEDEYVKEVENKDYNDD